MSQLSQIANLQYCNVLSYSLARRPVHTDTHGQFRKFIYSGGNHLKSFQLKTLLLLQLATCASPDCHRKVYVDNFPKDCWIITTIRRFLHQRKSIDSYRRVCVVDCMNVHRVGCQQWVIRSDYIYAQSLLYKLIIYTSMKATARQNIKRPIMYVWKKPPKTSSINFDKKAKNNKYRGLGFRDCDTARYFR